MSRVLAVIFGITSLVLAAMLVQNHRSKFVPPPAKVATERFPPPPAGFTEFTAKLMSEFPERIDRKQGYMDGTFVEIDGSQVSIHIGDLYTTGAQGLTAFTVRDQRGDFFHYCLARKSEFGDLLLKLKEGDRVRVIGQAVSMASDVMWIRVSSIDISKR